MPSNVFFEGPDIFKVGQARMWIEKLIEKKKSSEKVF